MDSKTIKRSIILAVTVIVVLGISIFGLLSMQSALSINTSPESLPTISSGLPTGDDSPPEVKW